MKKLILILSILTANEIYSQKQTKITSYSLGEVYENIKNDNFLNFKLKCGSWVNNVKYQYAVQLLQDSRNNNTLIDQINNETIKSSYEDMLSNINKIASRVGFYSNSESECPLIKYKFVKTILDFYEATSKYHSELDNIQTDKFNAKIDFDNQVNLENERLVNEKKNENNQNLLKIEEKYNSVLIESGLKTLKDDYENKVETSNNTLNKNLEALESQTNARIKKLPISNFAMNKRKIITESENKRISLINSTKKLQLDFEKNYNDSLAKSQDTYSPILSNIEKQKEEILNFDYETIKKHPVFDDSSYNTQMQNITVDYQKLIEKFNKNISTLENLRSSGAKIINLL